MSSSDLRLWSEITGWPVTGVETRGDEVYLTIEGYDSIRQVIYPRWKMTGPGSFEIDDDGVVTDE